MLIISFFFSHVPVYLLRPRGKASVCKEPKKKSWKHFYWYRLQRDRYHVFFFFFVQMQLGLFIAETAALSCSAGLGGAHPHTINQNLQKKSVFHCENIVIFE
jgi:hypothetical protein